MACDDIVIFSCET